MLSLLNLEWKKFKKNSVVKMLFLIYALVFPILMLVFKDENTIPETPFFDAKDIFRYPGIWEWLGYIGNWMVFFTLGFMIVYMISIEVSYKTMRQNVITGLSRWQYFLSKLNLVILFSLIATIYFTIVGCLMGFLSDEEVTFAIMFDNEYAIPRFFLMCLGYLSFAMFIGFAIKNSGLAVLTYLAYGLMLEPIIRVFGHRKLFDGTSHNYYPLNAMEDLAPMPLPNENMKETIGFLSYSHASIATIIYVIIFLALTYYIFKSRDI